MAEIIVSAFEPFGGASVNGSEQILRRLMEQDEWRERIRPVVLPVVRGEAEARLLSALRDGAAPRLLVALGEAGPEPVIRLEMVALNFDDFRIPDNGGNQPRHQAIMEGGPAAYFASAPIHAALETLEDADRAQSSAPIPVRLSLSAGAFVCNHLFYTLRHTLEQEKSALPFVFVHVPAWRPEHQTLELDPLAARIAQVLQMLMSALG